MDAREGPDSPAPDVATPDKPPGSGWLGLVARTTVLPLAFGGAGLCVGLLVGLWRGMDEANDAGGTAIGGDLASMISGLVAFVLYAAGGLAAGLSLGMAIVVGMSFKQRAR